MFFEEKFIDCIPVISKASATEGYAFISLRSYAFNQLQQHAVYLHRMFLSDKAINVLPEWIFFAKCMINSKELRPTASRESFYEDEKLTLTRQQLGECIISYLFALKTSDPKLLSFIVSNHQTAIKLAAVSNDDFFHHIYAFVPFETNYGRQTLGDLLNKKSPLKYVTDVNEFEKLAGVANNQSIEIINAGYVYETSFLEKLTALYPDYQIEKFDAAELMFELEELNLDEREKCFDFLQLANVVLQEFQCTGEIRKFVPVNIPGIYFKNNDMDYLRGLQKSKDVADTIWGGILDNLSEDASQNAQARLCFNYYNPILQKATTIKNKQNLSIIVKMLYVQSLLLGRHSLQKKELSLLTNGLDFLIEKLTENDG